MPGKLTGQRFFLPAVVNSIIPLENILRFRFVNRENFVECDDNNFYDLAMYYLKNEAERKRIARNGYNLIHSKHTDRVRVMEFLKMVESYLEKIKCI